MKNDIQPRLIIKGGQGRSAHSLVRDAFVAMLGIAIITIGLILLGLCGAL